MLRQRTQHAVRAAVVLVLAGGASLAVQPDWIARAELPNERGEQVRSLTPTDIVKW